MTDRRVLINASIIDEHLTGVGVYAVEVISGLIKNLIAEGIDYEIYAYKNPYLNFVDNAKFKEIVPRSVTGFSLFERKAFHRLYWNLAELPKIAKKFCAVYSPSSHGGLTIKNQIVTVHDLICLKYPFQNFFQFIYFKLLLKSILKSSKVIAISQFTKQKILENYNFKGDVKVIYNGCDHIMYNSKEGNQTADLSNIGLRNNDKYFLSVGAALAHKNILRLLDAVQELRNKDIKFVIIGKEGKYFNVLKRKIKADKIENVILLNYVSSQTLSLLYKKCLAMVYISLYEGFGFPPLEAALYGKPSIVSNTSCLPEIYGDSALFVDPYSVKSIRQTLEAVIENENILERVSDKLPALIDKYRWEYTTSRIFTLLKTKC